jgi:hypothetical protein
MEQPVSRDPSSAQGFVVEVGGQVHSSHASYTEALKAGLAIKSRNAQAAVKVYEAGERPRASAA